MPIPFRTLPISHRERTGEGEYPMFPGVEGAVSNEPKVVSAQEKRTYVLSRMRGGNEAHQILTGLRFDGALDRATLTEAFRKIADKHPKLRSTYDLDASEVTTRVLPEITPECHLLDSTQDPTITADDVATVMNAPFDMSQPPLWRYGIIVDRDGTEHLVIAFHHIIADDTSVEIILNDLNDYLNHGRLDPDSASEDYGSFVSVQAERERQPGYEDHREWWLREFDPIPAPLDLPTDSPNPLVNDFSGHRYHFSIDRELHEAATAVMAELDAAPADFYLALWSLVLARASSNDDLCVGVPLDHRNLGPFTHTVGNFADHLPLRVHPTPETRVCDLVQEIGHTRAVAAEHSLYTYDDLVLELDRVRDYRLNAIFDATFTYTPRRAHIYRFGGLDATSERISPRGATYALTLELADDDDGLSADLNYSSVYSERRMAELAAQFEVAVKRAVQDPLQKVRDIALLDDATRDQLIARGTGPEVTSVPSLTELFDAAFRTYADHPAIRFRGEYITYAQLAQRVDQYAALLQSRGAFAGDVIGLLLPPSPDIIVAMLAINRIGGIWLTMDTKNPPKRLEYLLDTAAPSMVICSDERADDVGDLALVIRDEDLDDHPTPALCTNAPDDLAYVIFTSGSTGNPKGVMLTNGSLANFLQAMPKALRWAENKTVACFTTPSFDIYLLESLLTVATGGTVVVPEEDDPTPTKTAELIVDNSVDYLQMTPTRLRLLFADPRAAATALASLEKIIIGGEGFPEDLLPDLKSHPSLEIFNAYGPTETCIWSSVKDLTADPTISIGTAIDNTTLYVLDDNLQLVPDGTAGNLWIGGDGVSPGYLNRAELTEQVFRPNPFGPGRIYLTGDQAEWRNGKLHCLGRIDNQVKVRGFRIELEEIELAIASHELVTGAAAVVHEVSAGNQVIRGFFQTKENAPLEPQELKAYLADSLADYMMPATVTQVPEIPTTTSGKVDRKALVVDAESTPASGSPEPPSGIDQELITAWKKVLGNVAIGYDDSFFDLGGNSLSLVLLLEEIDAVFPGVLDVSDLFANPTIRALRAHLETQLDDTTKNAAARAACMPLPASWFGSNATSDGRAATTASEHARWTLKRLHDDTAYDTDDVVTAVFVLALGKILGYDEVALNVVTTDSETVPVRITIAGKSDLAEVLDELRSQIRDTSSALSTRRCTAARGVDGMASIACCNSVGAESAELLRHFDIVFGVTDASDSGTFDIVYNRTVDSAHVELLLSGFIKVLSVLGDNTPVDGETADITPSHSESSKEKHLS